MYDRLHSLRVGQKRKFYEEHPEAFFSKNVNTLADFDTFHRFATGQSKVKTYTIEELRVLLNEYLKICSVLKDEHWGSEREFSKYICESFLSWIKGKS